jgi:hypothetical protein
MHKNDAQPLYTILLLDFADELPRVYDAKLPARCGDLIEQVCQDRQQRVWLLRGLLV